MPRITVSLKNNLYIKLLKFAMENQYSLSKTMTGLAEVGLRAHEKQHINNDGKSYETEEVFCYKLIIESDGLLRIIDRDQH